MSQHWDAGYETVFVHVFPDGTFQTNYLEGSGPKRWRARIFADEKERRATVVLSKFQKKVVGW
ncbi:MAG TPA: hypothetical protein VGR78_08895 [Verrucomicrobiae bacterium]|nr:hypothetical protein [Verrucomicrobiae bacterium]